jgi:uncharacterized protein DUF4382
MDLATRKMVYYGLLGLLIAGSTIAVFRIGPPNMGPFLKDGTLNVYMSSIQPDIQGNTITPSQVSPVGTVQLAVKSNLNLLSLNVTIDSITVHASDESDPSGVTHTTSFTFDVLKPLNVATLISSEKVPVENVTMVSLHVSKAVAAVTGITGLASVKVPSDELKIPVSPALHVEGQKTSSIVVSGTAHVVFEGNNDIMLTPVLHVERTTGPD